MQSDTVQQIGRLVRDNLDLRTAMATVALLEVGMHKWTSEDDESYGTMISAIATEED